MSETTSNKVQPAKKANAKKTANGADSKLFVSPVVSAIFWTISIVLVVAVIFFFQEEDGIRDRMW